MAIRQNYLLPEDLQITNEEISKQISMYGSIEWRSKKNLYSFLQNNKLPNWTVVGYVSAHTMQKWEDWEHGSMWLLAKDREVKYIYTLGIVV